MHYFKTLEYSELNDDQKKKYGDSNFKNYSETDITQSSFTEIINMPNDVDIKLKMLFFICSKSSIFNTFEIIDLLLNSIKNKSLDDTLKTKFMICFIKSFYTLAKYQFHYRINLNKMFDVLSSYFIVVKDFNIIVELMLLIIMSDFKTSYEYWKCIYYWDAWFGPLKDKIKLQIKIFRNILYVFSDSNSNKYLQNLTLIDDNDILDIILFPYENIFRGNYSFDKLSLAIKRYQPKLDVKKFIEDIKIKINEKNEKKDKLITCPELFEKIKTNILKINSSDPEACKTFMISTHELINNNIENFSNIRNNINDGKRRSSKRRSSKRRSSKRRSSKR